MNFRPLLKVLIVVLALSIYWGYLQSISPWLVSIWNASGLDYTQIGAYLTYLSIAGTIVGYGGGILILTLSYYAGKKYVLTTESILILVLLVILVNCVGTLIGYLIGQLQLPQYPVLNISLIADIVGSLLTPILWVLVGMFAGNYKRELDTRKLQTSTA